MLCGNVLGHSLQFHHKTKQQTEDFYIMDRDDIFDQIIKFLNEKFKLDYDNEAFELDDDLFEEGYIDSKKSQVVIDFLEKTFSVKVSKGAEIGSVNDMVDYIADKKGL